MDQRNKARLTLAVAYIFVAAAAVSVGVALTGIQENSSHSNHENAAGGTSKSITHFVR